MKTIPVNLKALSISLAATAALFLSSLFLIHIDTDITRYLPQNDPVISSAQYVFKNHPIQDQLVMDIFDSSGDRNVLVSAAALAQKRLLESGFFEQVGHDDFQALMPGLMAHVVQNLPVLFNEKELNDWVTPLLSDENIQKRLKETKNQLLSLEGIGQARFFSRDPLALRNLVLARLSHLAPFQNVQIYQGNIVSPDGKHLLLTAKPKGSGTDTALAGKLTRLFEQIQKELGGAFDRPGKGPVLMTPVGAYRAALDNEMIARQDVKKALILVTAGIALLLVLAFYRPLLGLFAFLPALAGTACALFVFALFCRSVSIMVLGFGGAVISITIDHAIAFLLFLDQPYETRGLAASRETRAVGLLAALTSMGAFGALYFSGFPLFEQIGQFTALGIAFAFLFVHTVFPKIFPVMPPAKNRSLPLRRLVDRAFDFGRTGAWVACLWGVGMAFFAWPEFNVDLSAMNTVSQKTRAAEKRVTDVWGSGMFQKVIMLTKGTDLQDISKQGDLLVKMIDEDIRKGFLSAGFVPSMICPGKGLAEENFEAWKRFWSQNRVQDLKKRFLTGEALGFSPGAFDPFLHMISNETRDPGRGEIPADFLEFMGIREHKDGSGWLQVLMLTPGTNYSPEIFFARYGKLAKIFDPSFFSAQMGRLLFSSFTKMLCLVGASVVILLIFFFLDWKLTLVSLLPILFALVCTLGTLNLLGHALDIPGLMLSIIVVGMGIDYSLFLVRAYQRYGSESNIVFERVKMTVFMACASTLIGFGVLVFAEHSMLASAGLTSLIGISYALIGAFLILPPILKYLFEKADEPVSNSLTVRARILGRYRKMEPYPRQFARFKMKMDPMFNDLPRFLDFTMPIQTIIDIGTGYGVPACWLAEHFQSAKIYGIDPISERVRVAAMALGENGNIQTGRAPEVPKPGKAADVAVVLDVIHFLNDEELKTTLERIHRRLKPEGLLVIRAVIPPRKRGSWLWKIQAIDLKLSRTAAYFRSPEKIYQTIVEAGFACRQKEPLKHNEEARWFIGKAI